MHFSEHFTVGLYFSYGIGLNSDQVSAACDEAEDANEGVDVSCTQSDIRLGTAVYFHASPGSAVDPWFGAGTGYEWLSLTQRASAGGQRASTTLRLSGFEIVNLQAGVDFKLAERIGLGPFVAFSEGSFGSVSASCENIDCPSESADVENPAGHQWLLFRARFGARL